MQSGRHRPPLLSESVAVIRPSDYLFPRPGAWKAYLLVVALSLAAVPACASTQVLQYNVVHPWLGKIGTYVNTIVRRGEDVTVTSSLRVVASLLGIVVHRQYADRVEVWHDGRLVSFDGVTTINGKPLPVRGRASDGHFVVTSPDGTVAAPADVYPNNPWSCDFIRGTSVFAVNTGTVEPAQVTGGYSVYIELGQQQVVAREYRIESKRTHARVWLSPSCVPLRMDVVISGTNISLILAHETRSP
jgi:hypothetical protein